MSVFDRPASTDGGTSTTLVGNMCADPRWQRGDLELLAARSRSTLAVPKLVTLSLGRGPLRHPRGPLFGERLSRFGKVGLPLQPTLSIGLVIQLVGKVRLKRPMLSLFDRCHAHR